MAFVSRPRAFFLLLLPVIFASVLALQTHGIFAGGPCRLGRYLFVGISRCRDVEIIVIVWMGDGGTIISPLFLSPSPSSVGNLPCFFFSRLPTRAPTGARAVTMRRCKPPRAHLWRRMSPDRLGHEAEKQHLGRHWADKRSLVRTVWLPSSQQPPGRSSRDTLTMVLFWPVVVVVVLASIQSCPSRRLRVWPTDQARLFPRTKRMLA